MRDRLALMTLTGLGLGRLRPAPGTIGSLPPVVLAVVFACMFRGGAANVQWIVNLSLVGLGGVFAWSCLAFGSFGERRFGRKDPPDIVADEIAGQSLALWLLPWRDGAAPAALTWNLSMAATAFVAFRAFDILKPPPCARLQRLPAGWGILLDDLAAGAYALAATQVAVRWVWPTILG